MTSEMQSAQFDPNHRYSLKEAKDLLKQNKGAPLGGLLFWAENSKGERTEAMVLPELSSRGKLQAVLKCLGGGPDHIREVSDWHQSLWSSEGRKKEKVGSPAPMAGNASPAEVAT